MNEEQLKELGFETAKNKSNVLVSLTNMQIVTAKTGKQYLYDGSEFYHYSDDGKEFFIKECPQDFETLKALING